MNWLGRLFGHDGGEGRSAAERKLDRLEAASDANIETIDRVAAEQKQLAATLKNVTKAMRADARK